MNDKATIVKAGTLFSFESGDYSEYGVIGFFVALQDFDPVDFAEKAEFDKDRLLADLIRAGCILEIQRGVLWITDYPIAALDSDLIKYTPSPGHLIED